MGEKLVFKQIWDHRRRHIASRGSMCCPIICTGPAPNVKCCPILSVEFNTNLPFYVSLIHGYSATCNSTYSSFRQMNNTLKESANCAGPPCKRPKQTQL